MDEIEVVYTDGMFGFVDPLELNRLIESGGIVKFLRGDSWVYPGVDPTRAVAEDRVSTEAESKESSS